MTEEAGTASPAARATFVLVHGGGHGGWCWSRVAGRLRAAGCDVHTPTLTGLGERAHLLTPEVGLETHIADVVNLLVYEDLTDVILVGHSYGGLVITGVADRALERIAQMVYFDAAIPRDGESLADTSPGLRKFAHADTRVVDGVPLVLWPGAITQALYGVSDPAAWAWMEPRLTPQPLRTFEEPLRLRNAAAVDALPRTIVNCTSTLRVREPGTIDRYFSGDRVWEIDTGHDLMITEPEASAEMLLRLV
ncbi:alpha/beta fold hydrolase [Phenylobacterium sp. LjRoot219]|uniref:alpha/beta fold hydrolase n=1 Tax=Phenylobacterium sp. LjRoot219 TaxID=3342283 RepID=UPI003ECD13EB